MQSAQKTPDDSSDRFVASVGPFPLRELGRFDDPRAQPWADSFLLAREHTGSAERGRLYRSLAAGAIIQLRRGLFVQREIWNAAHGDERYLLRIRAAAVMAAEALLFSSGSAAALWRLPVCGEWPTTPVVLTERAAGGRSVGELVRRCEGLPEDFWVVDGLPVTNLARTVVDVARFATRDTAIAMTDRALAEKPATAHGALAMRAEKSDLLRELAKVGDVRGHVRARATIEFADGASGSVGESISRLAIHTLGFVAPILQFEFRDARGRMFGDFWWPDYNLIGEFDGKGKYLRDEYTAGRSTADVVMAEKAREDRLRRLGPSVVRWGWAEACSPPTLRRLLLDAGLGYR